MGQELYKLIKEQIRIEDYAGKRFGFTIIRKGKYFSLREHDSVIIDPQKNCYWRNSVPGSGRSIGKGGSVIDFAMEFSGLTLHEVLKELTTEVYGDGGELPEFEKTDRNQNRKRVKTQEFVLPEKAGNMRRVFAYLIKTRGIAKEVVQLLVNRKQLYQDVHGNCVFVGYDRENKDKAVFATMRGTNTGKPFYGDAEASDYKQCWYLDNGTGRLYVTESVIDAMSKMTLLRSRMKSFDYLALSGAGKCECLKTYLPDPKLMEIWIGTDQDKAGEKAAELIRCMAYQMRPDVQVFTDIPKEAKDWNAVLMRQHGWENV